jgi:hypothetical protein
LTIVALMMAALGCVAPTVTDQDSDAVNTAVAETLIAEFVQISLSQTLPPTFSFPTLTPGLPTFTPTSTSTPSPTLTPTLAFTPTPLVPLIGVTVPTNCRVGPGRIYRRVGALLIGETAQVYGRDPTGRYWYIQNPDSAGGYCWLWGEYATVVGNTTFLPVFTPPPTPTATFTPRPTFTPVPSAAFVVEYDGLEGCGDWWVELELQNTGTIPFESMGLIVRDTVTSVVLTSFADRFTNNNGCDSTNTRDSLNVGRTRVVSAPVFNYDPTGHKLQATIILCSSDENSGTCLTKTINFTP